MVKSNLEVLCERLEKFTLAVNIFICGTMLVVAWMHVTRRYVFNDALTWSEEFLRFSIVWYAMLSASVLHKRNGHLGITIFRDMMPARVRELLERAVIYLDALTVALVTVFGTLLTLRTWEQTTPALGIPVSWPYAAIPVSFLLMTVYSVVHMVRDIQGLQPLGAGSQEK